ncbi:MAG: hypothetical protein K0S01_4137 [Herbinix sp.]|nr:hypothetical protein [Herbinix sp.]
MSRKLSLLLYGTLCWKLLIFDEGEDYVNNIY